MMKKMRLTVLSVLPLMLLAFGLNAQAAMDGMKNRIVIQVSTNDEQTQQIALNNAVNVQKALGQDNVAIEIVAYGPGLGMLTAASAQKDRVTSLAMQDITFSACGNTMDKVERTTGKKPVLLEGVQVVPAGVLRIMELQQQGYAYLRP